MRSLLSGKGFCWARLHAVVEAYTVWSSIVFHTPGNSPTMRQLNNLSRKDNPGCHEREPGTDCLPTTTDQAVTATARDW